MGASGTEFVRLPQPGTGLKIWQPYGKPAPVLGADKIARGKIGNVTKVRKIAINNIGNLTRTIINTTSPVRLPTKQGVTPPWHPYEQKYNLISSINKQHHTLCVGKVSRRSGLITN